MNLRQARVVLRPRSLPDVLDLGLLFVVENRRAFAPLLGAVIALGLGLALLVRSGLGQEWWVVWCALALFTPVAEGVFTIAAGDLLLRAPAQISAREVLVRTLRRLPSQAASLLMRGLLVGAALFVVVAVPFAAAPFVFVSEAILLERAPLFTAFRRSGALARHRWGACFALWLFVLLLPVLGAWLADLMGTVLLETVLQLGRPFGSLIDQGGSWFAVVGAMLALPFAAAARFLGYIDLRTRKEGWDIQLRFTALRQHGQEPRTRAPGEAA